MAQRSVVCLVRMYTLGFLLLLGCDSSSLDSSYVEANVNGEEWHGQGSAEFLSTGELLISALRWNGGNTEEIQLYIDYDGLQTYRLAEKKARFRTTIGGDVIRALYQSVGSKNDWISFLQHDPVPGRLVGRFTFNAQGPTGNIDVQNGTFDVELTNPRN